MVHVLFWQLRPLKDKCVAARVEAMPSGYIINILKCFWGVCLRQGLSKDGEGECREMCPPPILALSANSQP